MSQYIDNPILTATVDTSNATDVVPDFDSEVVTELATLDGTFSNLEIDSDTGNASDDWQVLEITHYATHRGFEVYLICRFDECGCGDTIEGTLGTFATADQARAFIRELTEAFNARNCRRYNKY